MGHVGAGEIEVVRGDTPTIRIGPITRPDSDGVEQLVNLLGASGKLTARISLESNDVVFEKAEPVFDVARALADFVLDAEDTQDLPVESLVYDAEIVEDDGTVTTFPRRPPGRMTLLGDVTRPEEGS